MNAAQARIEKGDAARLLQAIGDLKQKPFTADEAYAKTVEGMNRIVGHTNPTEKHLYEWRLSVDSYNVLRQNSRTLTHSFGIPIRVYATLIGFGLHRI